MVRKKPVVLMGFMGSGKSTLGLELAKILGLEFTDLDKIIESSAGMTIPEIFEKKGEPYFRKLESEALARLLDDPEQVLSIGGGAPCNDENIRLIKEKSLSVYLKTSVDELVRRLTSSKTPRPLLAGKDPSEIRTFISELLETREKYYSKADMILASDSTNVELVLIGLADRGLVIDD